MTLVAKVCYNTVYYRCFSDTLHKCGILVGTILGFFVLNIAGICLRCLFPLTNRPACDAGKAEKVEPLSTFTVAAAHCLRLLPGS